MMKSLLTKRLPGILAAVLVALAVGAAGVAPASAADATSSALTKAQKKKKAKALKACKKKKKAKPRKACIKKVNKKYKKLAKKQKPAKGKTHRVDILDPYSFSPNLLTIKANDSILWDWRYSTGREPHDVTPSSVPAGVNRLDFKSQLRTGPNFTFKRQFVKPGKYSFVCSIHFQMTMDVTVKK